MLLCKPHVELKGNIYQNSDLSSLISKITQGSYCSIPPDQWVECTLYHAPPGSVS